MKTRYVNPFIIIRLLISAKRGYIAAVCMHLSDLRRGKIMNCWRIDVYVPESHAEVVKDAMFEAGAGRIGNYDRCCFQIRGKGQFRALDGSNPFIGTPGGGTETVEEVKIEIICKDSCLKDVLSALKKAHPYETPAFQYWKVETE